MVEKGKAEVFKGLLEGAIQAKERLACAGREDESNVSVQKLLVINGLLEKELGNLIEAYQVLLEERSHLELLIVEEGKIESLDDLELVGQYVRTLRDTNAISRREIARLSTATNVPVAADLRARDVMFQQLIKDLDRLTPKTVTPLELPDLTHLESSMVALHAKNVSLEGQLAELKQRLKELEIQDTTTSSSTQSSPALRSEILSSTCLRDELDLMTQEMRRLQVAQQDMDYARNVFAKYLQMPDQRRSLVRVLAALFKLEIPRDFQ